MKKLIVILGMMLSASSVFALDGYDATQMTCAEVQSIVQRDGQITILHKPFGSMTYYADRQSCYDLPYNADARPGYEPTIDSRACLVGWRCYIRGD